MFFSFLSLIYIPFFLFFSLKFYKRIWNPLLLFFIMFIFSIFFSATNNLYNIKNLDSGVLWISIGMFLFAFSFLLTQYCIANRIKPVKKIYSYKKSSLHIMSNLCVIFAFISFLLSIYSIMQITDNLMDVFIHSYSVRVRYLERQESVFFSLFAVFISIHYYIFLVPLIISVYQKQKKSILKLFTVIVLVFCSSIITMSKEQFIINCLIIISVFIQLIPDRKTEYRFYLRYGKWVVCLFIGLLFIVSFQRNYVGNQYNSYFQAILGTIYEYIGCPVQSFGELITVKSVSYTNGAICFRPIVNVLSHLGFTERISIVQEVIGNSSGNVYTIFGNMFRDFGFLGIVVLSIFYGSLLGAFYYTKGGNKIHILTINSMILMTMFFGFYDLKIIQTVYPTIMIYSIIFDRIFKKKIYTFNFTVEKK